MKGIIATTILILFSILQSQGASVTFPFFTERIELQYDDSMLKPVCASINESGISGYHRQMEKTAYQVFLNDILAQQKTLGLNDWLSYELLQIGLQEIMKDKSQAEQELSAWFFLTKMGFETRIAYLDEQVFLYVRSEDEVFEIPMIEDNGERFVNLTNSFTGAAANETALYLLNFNPTPEGKSFGFYLTAFPNFQENIAEASVHFSYQDSIFRLNIQYDRTLVDVMEHYPLIAEEKYLELPFSKVLKTSLLPQFQQLIQGRTERQALELLLAFTRSSFEYKEDKVFFGRSKPMIPDEVFFYPYSDCEDRSALFYGMVKALLDLPMVVVAFPNHLTIAVALNEELSGAVIQYQGNRYYICDPTGPVNSAEIGVFPTNYKNSKFEIISSYK